jgi:hypothetical protein
MTVTKHDRTLEERKWADEVDLRRAELDIRRKETNWLSKFFSPLTTTLLAGILTLAASAIGALIQGNNGLTLEREKFVSSKELETQKQQHELLLKMIAVPDQSQAKANLQFLAESGLIDDALAKKIQASASKSTPLLPPPQLTMAPGRIDVVYETPKNAAYQVVYDRMKSRRVLEEISLFLGSLKLPRKILLKMSDCEFADPSYDSSNATVTVCYALLICWRVLHRKRLQISSAMM